MGKFTIALPIFQDTMLAMAVGIIVAILSATAVTFVLGFEDDVSDDATAAPAIENVPDDAVVAIADGRMIDIATVNDETFAEKVLGEGVAFELSARNSETILAPCTGTIGVLADTHHAIGITRKDGVEFLVHIGINTVALEGEGFTSNTLLRYNFFDFRKDRLKNGLSSQNVNIFSCRI